MQTGILECGLTMTDATSKAPITGVPRIHALLPCAGTGSRAASDGPKQYQIVAGLPMVLHTLAAFQTVERIDQCLLVLAPDDRFLSVDAPDVRLARCGGRTRAESVFNGLNALLEQGALADDWVLVHDAARCLVTPGQINALIDACVEDPVGGLLALRLPDTLKTEVDGRVCATVDRSDKWLAQTPQMFRLGALQRALSACAADGFQGVTDEASAMEMAGHKPRLVPGSAQNFKVTYPEDFALAESILKSRIDQDPNMNTSPGGLRMGEGWDVHALVPGRPLVIGGVTVPHVQGLLGHSDADVLLHAVTDAVLGAAALGDIGRHFPDTDARFKGADSSALLREAMRRVREAGFEIANVDATVIAQAPKLAPHIPAMCERLADALGVSGAQVNVKAKTAEKLGPVGQGLSIEARAVALLMRQR